jgi:hypothetical protein
MAQRSKGARLQLGEPVQTMLADFCAAHFDATERTVIRAALSAYIPDQLSKDIETKARYEAIVAARVRERG